MDISNDDITKEFLRKLAYNKQTTYAIKHLIELIDCYDAVRRDQCKNKLTRDGWKKTPFHHIAEMNYGELIDYAVKIKAGNPNLTDVPERSGNPDYDVSRLRQWAINVHSILSEQAAETKLKPDITKPLGNDEIINHKTEQDFKEKQGSENGNDKDESQRNLVFICYSHKDKRWLDDLQIHLKPSIRSESIKVWSDKQIASGSKWFPEIKKALGSTKVAVLLVTPHFLASDFINEHELAPILKDSENDKIKIIWIPVRACLYKETSLKDIQAVIDPEKPLATMKADRDKFWVKICEEIKKAYIQT